MDLSVIKKRVLWGYLTEAQKDLIGQSIVLFSQEEREEEGRFHDYSFLVFPAAKAYEGVLKKLFLDLELISPQQYNSNRFRIGRSLNPSLPERLRRNSWVYSKLTDRCQSEDLPQLLWQTWKRSRNLLFHWFPKHKNFITRVGAKNRIEMILSAMDQAFDTCPVNLPKT
ncbi:hypothetical protein CMO96_00070 [Candidatus Woesebacteria bacterium]|nr:hypothetical protein [Candidatus Woesebacteria bacterium]